MNRLARLPPFGICAFLLAWCATPAVALPVIEASATAGIRNDQVKWSIADPDGSPNIISELAWSNVRIDTVSLNLSARADILQVGLSYGAGTIVSGDNRDSDYGQDNHGCEFSRSNNDAGAGSARNLVLRANLVLQPPAWSRVQFLPYVGFSRQNLNLTIRDGMQTVSDPSCVPADLGAVEPQPLGPIAGLDSTYDLEWHGLDFGVGANVHILPEVRVHASYGWTTVDYSANADWNLRNDFAHPVSFRHTASGLADRASLGAEYRINDWLSLGAHFDWYAFHTQSGDAQFFARDGTSQVIPFNGAVARSRSLALSFTGVF